MTLLENRVALLYGSRPSFLQPVLPQAGVKYFLDKLEPDLVRAGRIVSAEFQASVQAQVTPNWNCVLEVTVEGARKMSTLFTANGAATSRNAAFAGSQPVRVSIGDDLAVSWSLFAGPECTPGSSRATITLLSVIYGE